MGDPDHRGAGPCAQRLRLGEDLRLDGNVESGGRLVGDDEVGLVDESDGDGDTLAHAAGQLVRVVPEAALGRGNADLGQCRPRALQRLGLAHPVVHAHGLDHLRVDPQDRIERHHRILEDHRDAVTPQRLQLGRARRRQLAALEADRALDDPSRRIDEAEDRNPVIICPSPTHRRGRGSRPSNVWRHAVDRLDHARLGKKCVLRPSTDRSERQAPWSVPASAPSSAESG